MIALDHMRWFIVRIASMEQVSALAENTNAHIRPRYPCVGDFLPTYATSQSITAGTYLTSVFPRQQGYSYTGAVVAHSGLVAFSEKGALAPLICESCDLRRHHRCRMPCILPAVPVVR